ncbi:MAG: response regulator [Bacteroidales bacterium]|nr:response regulator [Bacteroidales bacterium]
MKILILEDNKFDADFTIRQISKDFKDCHIDIASSIAEATKLININYDIALLDLKLPDGFGTDFLIELRKINKEIAIIMVSGLNDEEFIVSALKSGADDYIVKKEGYLFNLSEIILFNLTEKSKRNDRLLENIKVLYIEHHSPDIDLTMRHFKKVAPQFQFKSILSGEAALKLFDKPSIKSDPYDVLLMDYNLPGINAIEITKIIRQKLKLDIPIVIVTGQGNENIAIEALKLGADEYLVKRENYLKKLPYLLTNAYQRQKIKAKKKELIESESKYRLLFENNPQPIWIYDIETLKFLEVNKAAIDHYGYSKDEFLSMTLKDIHHIVEIDRFLTNLKKANDVFNFEGESRHRKKNGEIFIVETTSHGVNFNKREARHVLVKDISLRKKAEEQVQLLSASVEQSPASIIITNFDGVIEYVNPKFIEISGYIKDEIIGNNPRIVSSGLQDKKYYKILWETIKSGRIWQGEFANKKKNGEIFWENAIIAPIKNKVGEITHFVSVKEDITERKKMIDDLIIAKEKAEESDRLKSAFLANMSHEIRTPMNGILGFADLLTEPGLTGEKQKKYINMIEKSGVRMLNIINDIISISKIESGESDINLSEINILHQIEFVYNLLKIDAEKKGLSLSVINTLTDNEAVIKTDKDKLFAILSNLVKNAIKYTNEGEIVFGYNKKGEFLEFFIKDSGIGIAKDRQQAIFERFIQADIEDTMARQGAGLGLSISKAYVEMLGGKIWVESEIGKGSIFYFTLPYHTVAKEEKDNKSEISTSIENPLKKKLKILIAEDDKTTELFLEIIVNKFAKEILKTWSGLETVEICRLNPDIDLIFMDIRMPGMSGYESTRQIRKINKDVIIIAQTAYALSGDREKALEAGCDDYIAKPIKKDELISLIQKYFKS